MAKINTSGVSGGRDAATRSRYGTEISRSRVGGSPVGLDGCRTTVLTRAELRHKDECRRERGQVKKAGHGAEQGQLIGRRCSRQLSMWPASHQDKVFRLGDYETGSSKRRSDDFEVRHAEPQHELQISRRHGNL
jgi:hypothetical protein